MTFGQELVFHTTPSMFGKFFDACLEVVWAFKRRTFHIDWSRVKLILACQEVLK